MSRAAKVCATLSPWALRMLLSAPLRKWRLAAEWELWHRAIEDEVSIATDDVSDPWPCVMPRGMH